MFMVVSYTGIGILSKASLEQTRSRGKNTVFFTKTLTAHAMRYAMENELRDIPQQWIKEYVDKLLDVSSGLAATSPWQTTLMKHADGIMDMVNVFRKSTDNPPTFDANLPKGTL